MVDLVGKQSLKISIRSSGGKRSVKRHSKEEEVEAGRRLSNIKVAILIIESR